LPGGCPLRSTPLSAKQRAHERCQLVRGQQEFGERTSGDERKWRLSAIRKISLRQNTEAEKAGDGRIASVKKTEGLDPAGFGGRRQELPSKCRKFLKGESPPTGASRNCGPLSNVGKTLCRRFRCPETAIQWHPKTPEMIGVGDKQRGSRIASVCNHVSWSRCVDYAAPKAASGSFE